MAALASGDRDAFYEQERIFRERAHAPPFGRLAAIILSRHDGDAVIETGRALAKGRAGGQGRDRCGARRRRSIICCAARRANGLLVQAERNVDVQAYLRAWLARVKISNKVRVAVDIDPVSFF